MYGNLWMVQKGGEPIDLAELVEEFRSVGATPVLHHTDKGVCIGVGIGKGWPGGIGYMPKVLPTDPFEQIGRYLSNKGFNPVRFGV